MLRQVVDDTGPFMPQGMPQSTETHSKVAIGMRNAWQQQPDNGKAASAGKYLHGRDFVIVGGEEWIRPVVEKQLKAVDSSLPSCTPQRRLTKRASRIRIRAVAQQHS